MAVSLQALAPRLLKVNLPQLVTLQVQVQAKVNHSHQVLLDQLLPLPAPPHLRVRVNRLVVQPLRAKVNHKVLVLLLLHLKVEVQVHPPAPQPLPQSLNHNLLVAVRLLPNLKVSLLPLQVVQVEVQVDRHLEVLVNHRPVVQAQVSQNLRVLALVGAHRHQPRQVLPLLRVQAPRHQLA